MSTHKHANVHTHTQLTLWPMKNPQTWQLQTGQEKLPHAAVYREVHTLLVLLRWPLPPRLKNTICRESAKSNRNPEHSICTYDGIKVYNVVCRTCLQRVTNLFLHWPMDDHHTRSIGVGSYQIDHYNRYKLARRGSLPVKLLDCLLPIVVSKMYVWQQCTAASPQAYPPSFTDN